MTYNQESLGVRQPPNPEPPTIADYLAAIRDGMPRTDDEELTFRKAVWHMANHRIRSHIKNVIANHFWLRPEVEIRGYLQQTEEFFIALDSLAESGGNRQGDGFDEEALLQKLVAMLEREAPEFLADDGEQRLKEDLSKGLTKEDQDVLAEVTLTANLEFPSVPDDIRGLYERGIPRSLVTTEADNLRRSVRESIAEIQNFRFTPEELTSLSELVVVLEKRDRLLSIELHREMGEFDVALKDLDRNLDLLTNPELPITELRIACEKQMPYVFALGMEENLANALFP